MFEEITIESLELNPFETIGKEGFLITAMVEDSYNTMTAGWGFFGYMWKRPSFAVVVRDSRYTYQFIEKAATFTASFFPPSCASILEVCGSVSGRESDKIALTQLKPLIFEESFVTYEQANMAFCCTTASKTVLEPNQFIQKEVIEQNYPLKDYHSLYIGFIEKILVQTD